MKCHSSPPCKDTDDRHAKNALVNVLHCRSRQVEAPARGKLLQQWRGESPSQPADDSALHHQAGDLASADPADGITTSSSHEGPQALPTSWFQPIVLQTRDVFVHEREPRGLSECADPVLHSSLSFVRCEVWDDDNVYHMFWSEKAD